MINVLSRGFPELRHDPSLFPTRRPNLFSHVLDEVGTRIVSRRLRPGDTLPNETELARELGVSRSVVREALKSLAAKGLLDARARTGTRVREAVYWNLLDADVLAWRYATMPRGEFFRDLFEARHVIEPAAAELAAANATPLDIEVLARACADMEAAEPTAEAAIAADLGFHQSILAACHNELLLPTGRLIGLGLLTSFRTSTRSYGVSLPFHRPVYEAIRDHDAARARAAMLELLSRTLTFIESELLRNDGR